MSPLLTESYPELHRIMTSTARARTEPAPGGFMRSVMRHYDVDDLDEGIMMLNQPEKKSSSCPAHLNDLS
jgi:hypothetical protein